MEDLGLWRDFQREDSSSDRKNQDSDGLVSGKIVPVSGGIFPQNTVLKSQSLQSLEESSRQTPHRRPKTSTHWRNHPADRTPIVPILPATGGFGMIGAGQDWGAACWAIQACMETAAAAPALMERTEPNWEM